MASLMNCGSDKRVKNIINIYPEELLLKIFGFLDSASVKNLTLVNKRFYDIVVSETTTMKQLPLIIHDDILRQKHLDVTNLNPRFYKVLFDTIRKSFNTDMLSSLNEIGSSIREIEFVQCYVKKPKVIKNILSNFLLVEKLTFIDSSFRQHRIKSNDEVLELTNLKELVIKQSSMTVFLLFGAQLKSLKVNSSSVFSNEKLLMEFLYTQKRLETLALRTIKSSTAVFALKPNTEYQFKLKELSLRKISFKDKFEDDNLQVFLNTQKDSVEVLELGRTFTSDVYELILTKFKKLNTLRIDIAAFPADLCFYNKIRANKNVNTLMIYGENEDIVQYCKILSLFPNLTEIRISSQVACEVLSFLSKCCTALKSLSLDSLRSGNYNNVKFPSLKNLHMDWLDNQSEWKNFVMGNPTIESLSFKWVFEQLNMDPQDLCGRSLKMVCTALPNLKHLKIGGYMYDNMQYLRDIVEICKNMETMDVLEDNIEVGMMPMKSGFKFRCYDRSSIRHVFPTHGPIWKDDIGDKDTEDDEVDESEDNVNQLPEASDMEDNDEDSDDDTDGDNDGNNDDDNDDDTDENNNDDNNNNDHDDDHYVDDDDDREHYDYRQHYHYRQHDDDYEYYNDHEY